MNGHNGMNYDFAITIGGHTFSTAAIIGAFWHWLPELAGSVAGILAAIWYVVQIYESRTYQHWIRNRRMMKKAKKIARLKAALKVRQAELDALETVRVAKVVAREMVKTAATAAEKQIANEDAAAAVKLPPV